MEYAYTCFCFTRACVSHDVAQDSGLERVLVLDWDIHHGNGTQQIFEARLPPGRGRVPKALGRFGWSLRRALRPS